MAVPQPAAQVAPAGPGVGIQPQMFFLFMVYVKINNEAVWDRFFDFGVRGVDYQALVHCKSEASCKANIKSLHRFEVITSVETRYCFDLVGGMNALLKAALIRSGAGSPFDKFIFVSDSTLPVKPFSFMQAQLTQDAASDFCVFPRNEWAEVSEAFPNGTSVTQIAVKTHQWMILSRAHAATAVSNLGAHADLMQEFKLNMGFRNTGCLDEFWHFLVLYGALRPDGHPINIHLGGFNGAPLSTTNYEIQGQCDTFVHWVPRAVGTSNNVTRLAQGLLSDPGTELSPANEKRPASIGRLSHASLLQLRNSPFLFARKVDDGCSFSGCEPLDEAFNIIVFSKTPQQPPSSKIAWRGQGMWLDNRQLSVSIATSDGALVLVGSGKNMKAKGSYCQNVIKVVFVNGYRAEATLSTDGMSLNWQNGVVWTRPLGGEALP